MANMGDVLGGAYVVRGLLGTGGSGRVYLARKETDGKQYAIKEIPEKVLKRAGTLAELRLQEKLYHPALPHLWETWDENGYTYVAMDYVEGIPLDALLRERGAISEEQAVDLAKQLCKALVYLHGFHPPVIYRDMKPGNVILQKDGKVKLVDFGATRQLQTNRRHDTKPLGTPGYAAPEQYGRRPRSDERTDVYGLGVTLYQMLTGHDPSEPPYQICDIRDWKKDFSPVLSGIVRKCTERKPWKRYQSCEALLKALETYQEKNHKKFWIRIFSFLS